MPENENEQGGSDLDAQVAEAAAKLGLNEDELRKGVDEELKSAAARYLAEQHVAAALKGKGKVTRVVWGRR